MCFDNQLDKSPRLLIAPATWMSVCYIVTFLLMKHTRHEITCVHLTHINVLSLSQFTTDQVYLLCATSQVSCAIATLTKLEWKVNIIILIVAHALVRLILRFANFIIEAANVRSIRTIIKYVV